LLGPIFNRELLTIPRRERHYVTRVVYLGALLVLSVTVYLATMGWFGSATLGDMARFGPVLFQILTFVQLALFLFFSALSAASAIAQEKDRRTFVLLLMTDMRNYEIVLGKLFGSLLPIATLIVATVPLLMSLLFLGGVGFSQVIDAVLIVTATSLAAGSLGGLMALWRERTFQSLALTVLVLVLYLCLVLGLSWADFIGLQTGLNYVLNFVGVQENAVEISNSPLWLDPFHALLRVHHPDADQGAFSPAYGFALVMLGWTVLINGLGLLKLRVWNPSGEPIMQREKLDAEKELDAVEEADKAKQLARATAHAAPGLVRHVDGNPILWREIKTRAYGRRPLLVKVAYFVVLILIGLFALTPLVQGKPPADFQAAWGLLPIGVLSLLLVAAQATTAITSERDTGALDLLLVTDLSPREFIFGKLGGICYNTKEFLLPPLLLAVVYAFYGTLASPPANHPELLTGMNMISLFCILGASLVLLTFAMVLGIHVALRTQNSRLAVIHTLSTVFFLSVGTLVCIAIILINRRFEYQWGSFVFFLVAGIGGLWWVLNRERPSTALLCASIFCPLAVLYTVMNILVAKPGSQESADPVLPFMVIVGAFGFTVAAMMVPLLSEFDVAMGRTSGGAD
jgi:ABC-type transport system involved in multi-copper enzyme maturation permease subunit